MPNERCDGRRIIPIIIISSTYSNKMRMIVEERETKSDGSAEEASNPIDNKWLVNRSNQA